MSELLTNTPTPQSETNTAAIEQMHRDYEAMQMQEAQTASSLDGSFDDAIALQARDIGKRLIEEPTVETPKPNHTVRNTLFAAGAVASATVGVLGLSAMEPEVQDVPTFSEETNTYTVQDGDGIYNAVDSIPGINTIDRGDALSHIAGDPANIDVLKDGLQAGEQLVVPVSINGVESSNE